MIYKSLPPHPFPIFMSTLMSLCGTNIHLWPSTCTVKPV